MPYGRAPQRDFCQVERRQPACKPGSVRPGARERTGVTAIPLGRSLPIASSNQPGWQDLKTGPSPCGLRHPYSVLLPAGLAMPLPLPAARCALTAPFHPYPGPRALRRRGAGRFAFCGAIPGVTPAGRYPAPCLHGARTFLRACTAAVRPTGDASDMGIASERQQRARNWV